MKLSTTLSLLALALAVSGCATVLRGTKQDFSIKSTPAGATATLSTGQSCVTPCELHLRRKDAFEVTFTLPGYQSQTAQVQSGWSDGGTKTFIIGNVIAGGLIGMGVDAANGSTRDLFPNPLDVTLVPNPPPAPVAPAIAPVEPTQPAGAAPAEPAPTAQ